MKNKFEEHIGKIRSSMDADQPDDDKIWKGIEKGITRRPNYKRLYYWSLAAIIVLLLGIGYLFMNQLKSKKMQPPYYSLSNISEELGQQQQQYITLIAIKEEQINRASVDKPELDYLFKNLELISQLEKQFMEDLQKMPGNEKIINSLIRNYKRKIEILERILAETKKKEHYGNTIQSINL